jgi:hypothetical protein
VSRPLAVSCRRTSRVLWRLRRSLRHDQPLAVYLLRDPSLAERENTTPDDHALADILLAIDQLIDALDEWLYPSK